MSRFFKAQVPVLGTDFMFDTPWDEVDKTLTSQQQTYDNTVATAALLNSQLNVNHLSTDYDKKAVADAQKYYGDKITEITNQLMADPSSRVKGSLITLTNELTKDMSTGTLSKVKGRFDQYQAWTKQNEKMRNDNPNVYGRAYAKGMKNLQNGYNTSGHNASWGEDNIMEDIDWTKDVNDIIKNMEPEMRANSYAKVGGQWIYKGKNSEKALSQTRIMQAVENKIKSDPKFASYVQQRGGYGVPGYTDETGNFIPMFAQDDKGNLAINNKSAFAAPLRHAGAFAYTQQESEQDMEDNPYVMEATQQANRLQLATHNSNLNIKEEQVKDALTRQRDADGVGTGSGGGSLLSTIFNGTASYTTPEQRKAVGAEIINDSKAMLATFGVKPVYSGGVVEDASVYLTRGLASLRATLKNLKPGTEEHTLLKMNIQNLANTKSNFDKNEFTSGAQGLYRAEIQGGKKPKEAQAAVTKLVEVATKGMTDLAYLGSTKGRAIVIVYDKNNNRIGGSQKMMNGGLDFTALPKFHGDIQPSEYKTLKDLIGTEGGLKAFQQQQPVIKAMITNRNDPNFTKLNSIGTKFSVPRANGGHIVIEYDIALQDSGWDSYNTMQTGNSEIGIQSNSRTDLTGGIDGFKLLTGQK